MSHKCSRGTTGAHGCDCAIGSDHSWLEHEKLISSFDKTAPLTFTLTITLGNEGMQTSEDVADALVRTAEALPFLAGNPRLLAGFSAGIRDLNGNTVGSWKVE